MRWAVVFTGLKYIVFLILGQKPNIYCSTVMNFAVPVINNAPEAISNALQRSTPADVKPPLWTLIIYMLLSDEMDSESLLKALKLHDPVVEESAADSSQHTLYASIDGQLRTSPQLAEPKRSGSGSGQSSTLIRVIFQINLLY